VHLLARVPGTISGRLSDFQGNVALALHPKPIVIKLFRTVIYECS
jgi:hypothetical protein